MVRQRSLSVFGTVAFSGIIEWLSTVVMEPCACVSMERSVIMRTVGLYRYLGKSVLIGSSRYIAERERQLTT